MLHYQSDLPTAFNEPITTEPAYDSVKSVFSSTTRTEVDARLSEDEAALPFGIKGSPEFIEAYASERMPANNGQSLRDLSMQRRLYRCSPLIYSEAFLAIPVPLKIQIYAALANALDPNFPDDRYDYIKSEEKHEIRAILSETHSKITPFLSPTKLTKRLLPKPPQGS